MKTFKQFCEEYREPDLDKIERQSERLLRQGAAAIKSGNLKKASDTTNQLGRLSAFVRGV